MLKNYKVYVKNKSENDGGACHGTEPMLSLCDGDRGTASGEIHVAAESDAERDGIR